MILVILPLGKEAKDVADWLVRVFMYTVGTTIGATALAFVLAVFGNTVLHGLNFQWVVGVLGVASFVFALKELNLIKLWTPQIGWQVPKSWMKHSRLLGQTAYGVVLGAGIFTYIPFASFFVVLGWEAAVGAVSIPAAMAIGAVYGVVRGIPAVLGGISMLRGQYPLPVSNWLIAHLGWWHAINGLALLFVASFLLGSFVF